MYIIYTHTYIRVCACVFGYISHLSEGAASDPMNIRHTHTHTHTHTLTLGRKAV